MLTRLQRSLSTYDRTVRWVTQDQMHLTLKFLGEVEDHRVSVVTDALASTAAELAALTLASDGAGCFPPGGKVRVVWVGLGGDQAPLLDCQRKVESALESIGFPREHRPFSPHLTLGRVKDDRTGGALRDAVAGLGPPELTQAVVSIVLMSSELRPEGARYTRVGEWKLGAGH